jgi:hypothetical protein
MRDVLFAGAKEVIQADDFVLSLQEFLAKVRADKPGATCD